MTYNDIAWQSGRNQADTDRRWTRKERLASLIHSQANAGRSAQDRSDAADAALVAPIPTTTRAALRAIEARRVASINPADLNGDALGRYASQWAGTARGDAALAEIARRPSVAFDVPAYDATDGEHAEIRDAADRLDSSAYAAEPFNALDYPAGYVRCKCAACQDLAKRETEIRAARVTDDTPTPNRFTVTEHIRHGNYRYDLTEAATTLLGAVYAVLVASPYATATSALADRIAGDLFTTGHAEHGWSTFER